MPLFVFQGLMSLYQEYVTCPSIYPKSTFEQDAQEAACYIFMLFVVLS